MNKTKTRLRSDDLKISGAVYIKEWISREKDGEKEVNENDLRTLCFYLIIWILDQIKDNERFMG